MKRSELKEIINAVIGKLKENTPASACGICFADNDEPVTTEYAVGEEDPTTRYSMGEEDPVKPIPTPILRYSIREES